MYIPSILMSRTLFQWLPRRDVMNCILLPALLHLYNKIKHTFDVENRTCLVICNCTRVQIWCKEKC
jgi:hypothetical protein